MKIAELKELLKDPRVMEEIHKHLWIESQKAGYNIGLERATDEWLRLYAEGWMKFHLSEKSKRGNNGEATKKDILTGFFKRVPGKSKKSK